MGENYLQLGAVGHARHEIGAGRRAQFRREADLLAAGAGAVGVHGAAVQRAADGCRAPARSARNCESSRLNVRLKSVKKANVTCEMIGIRYSRLPVKDVSPPTVTSRVDRQRNLDVPQRVVGWIPWYRAAVRVGQVEVDARWNKRVRCRRTDVEAADIRFAAAIDAVERRRDLAAEALRVGELRAHTQHVMALAVDAETLHGVELPEAGDGREVLYIAAGARHLDCQVEVAAVVRTRRAIH